MSKITIESFKNFFKYYDQLEHQQRAVEFLYELLPEEAKESDCQWIETYRNKISEADAAGGAPAWPITKQEMAEIMGCAVSSLPDDLMDDYARCCSTFGLNRINQAYFLGQCGHESGGLRWPVELDQGHYLEGRLDLGNTQLGDGPKYRGHGWLQNTGRANTQAFADYMHGIGQGDPKIMEIGAEYVGNTYPWTVSGFWWHNNRMVEYCNSHPDVDRVGQRVNGRYLPNGFEDRRHYTSKAFAVLGV